MYLDHTKFQCQFECRGSEIDVLRNYDTRTRSHQLFFTARKPFAVSPPHEARITHQYDLIRVPRVLHLITRLFGYRAHILSIVYLLSFAWHAFYQRWIYPFAVSHTCWRVYCISRETRDRLWVDTRPVIRTALSELYLEDFEPGLSRAVVKFRCLVSYVKWLLWTGHYRG
jgi:hypothetical protein